MVIDEEKKRKEENKKGMQSLWHEILKLKQLQTSETKFLSNLYYFLLEDHFCSIFYQQMQISVCAAVLLLSVLVVFLHPWKLTNLTWKLN